MKRDAIAKGGTAPIQGVYEYGVRPAVKGLAVVPVLYAAFFRIRSPASEP